MRIYLDLKDKEERSNYIKFMEEVFSTSFHLSKSIKCSRRIYCYTSKDSNFDICWLRCENFNCIRTLSKEKILESEIYLITCRPQVVIQKSRTKQITNLYKDVYVPAECNENKDLPVMLGQLYGMDFNPTQCELNLFRFNSTYEIKVCLEHSFKKVYPLLERRFYGQYI